MTELEKVEKLREKANVSYTEAKEALDRAGGDLLDALIYLEKQGSANPPSGGGFYSGAGTSGGGYGSSYGSGKGTGATGGFSEMMKRFGNFCLDVLRKGTINYLDATKNGEAIFSCPVVVLVVLLLFFFWVTLPLIVISLFFGIRYRFSGPDLGREAVNKVMDSTSDIVNDVKNSFKEGTNKTSDDG